MQTFLAILKAIPGLIQLFNGFKEMLNKYQDTQAEKKKEKRRDEIAALSKKMLGASVEEKTKLLKAISDIKRKYR